MPPRRRLRLLGDHLATPGRGGPSAPASRLHINMSTAAAQEALEWAWQAPPAPKLLSDESMQHFVRDGFLVLPLPEGDFPASVCPTRGRLSATSVLIVKRFCVAILNGCAWSLNGPF